MDLLWKAPVCVSKNKKMNSTLITSKNISALVLIFLFSFSLNSQSEGEDVITLKNGNVYQGVVVEQKPGKHIKLLQVPSLDTVLIELKSIDLLSKDIELNNEQPLDTIYESTLDIPKLKMFNVNDYHMGLNYTMGGGDFSQVGLGIRLMRTVGPSTQVGVEVNYVSNVGQNSSFENSIPVSLRLSQELREHITGRTSLLANLNMGYNTMLNGGFTHSNTNEPAYYTSGMYLKPSLGYRLNLAQEAGIELSAGYQLITSKAFSKETDDLLINQSWSNMVFTGTFFF